MCGCSAGLPWPWTAARSRPTSWPAARAGPCSSAPAGQAGRGRPGRGGGRGALARPPARQPRPNLATLVSRLRAVLGAAAIASGQGWRFVTGPWVEVDLDEAERLAAEAATRLAGQPALALAAAERALDLLGRGPFLADEPDADWALPPRREAERLTARCRRLAWDAAQALGDPARALAHARAAVTADPFGEPAGAPS